MMHLSILTLAGKCLLLASLVFAEDKVKLEGIKCPVAGDKAAKAENAVEYKAGKVYFCCGKCPKEFAANKKKYATKANHQLVATGQANQFTCPFTGGEIDEDTRITVAGAKIAFCCENCKAKAGKVKDAEQVELLFNDKAFEKAGFNVSGKE